MCFDRFDICLAHYAFACLYHGGKSSKTYAKFAQLDRIGFKPSPLFDVDSLSENAREILDLLVERDGCDK